MSCPCSCQSVGFSFLKLKVSLAGIYPHLLATEHCPLSPDLLASWSSLLQSQQQREAGVVRRERPRKRKVASKMESYIAESWVRQPLPLLYSICRRKSVKRMGLHKGYTGRTDMNSPCLRGRQWRRWKQRSGRVRENLEIKERVRFTTIPAHLSIWTAFGSWCF